MTMQIMVQGTMSGAGKSLLVAALCRIFTQDGYNVAPFKSQNMALNSYITLDGFEMGRAQVVQAQAAGKEPDVRMNPILLKPSSDTGSQLIVNGEVRGDYNAADYYKLKDQLVPEILKAYDGLCAENDIMVIEGAGSPAEINLREQDIVNMGFARLVGAPVLLAGDIDRGGVFAQLYGTYALLDEADRAQLKGLIINKFRGDVEILRPGLSMLEELADRPVLGVVPYAQVDIDDEDSLAPRLTAQAEHKAIDIAAIRLPRVSNFTDLAALERHPLMGVRYVTTAAELGSPDLVVIPGTKSTIDDMLWMRQNGLESAIKHLAAAGTPVLGICGGYQMMGRELHDPDGIERAGTYEGMGLLGTRTVFEPQKVRTRVNARTCNRIFNGVAIEGYEIHMGRTDLGDCEPFCEIEDGRFDGAVDGNAFGTYLHGLFDTGELVEALARMLCEAKGIAYEQARTMSHDEYQETQFDLLAQTVRESLDIDRIYEIAKAGAR